MAERPKTRRWRWLVGGILAILLVVIAGGVAFVTTNRCDVLPRRQPRTARGPRCALQRGRQFDSP